MGPTMLQPLNLQLYASVALTITSDDLLNDKASLYALAITLVEPNPTESQLTTLIPLAPYFLLAPHLIYHIKHHLYTDLLTGIPPAQGVDDAFTALVTFLNAVN